MEATVKLKVRPFTTPNYVSVVTKKGEDAYVLPLSGLDIEVLEELCKEFRLAVLKKAKKTK